MAYKDDVPLIYDREADSDHDWVYVGCITEISPDRPPTLNADNFSSSEAGAPVNDPKIAAQIEGVNINMNLKNSLLVEDASSLYHSSTNESIQAPDGPEKIEPANKFLPVTPAPGLGEVQHRLRSTFDEVEHQINCSWSRWPKAIPANECSLHAPLEGLPAGWLRQDTHIVGPVDLVRGKRGKSSGSASILLSSCYSGASSGWRSSSLDPVTGSGAWIGESVSGSWPRELPDEVLDEDDD